MSRRRTGMSDEEREALCVTLVNVRVESLHPDDPFVPYFTVIHNGEVVKVRNRAPENFALLEQHRDKALDLTIFPYAWTVKGTSGVVNYFQRFKLHEEN